MTGSYDLEQAVARGVRYLDREYPGWRDRVDWDRLEMRMSSRDVFGMVDPLWRRRPNAGRWAIAFGQDLPEHTFGVASNASYEALYRHLGTVWRAHAGR